MVDEMNQPAQNAQAAQPQNAQPAQNALLESLSYLGEGSSMVQEIFEMIGRSKFYADFTRDDVERLTAFMHVYRASPGQAIIHEGDVDDYMILIIEGRVEIVKTDSQGNHRPMTAVGAGATLGEMSMIDGEPRFATCVAVDSATFSVLSRDSMVKIILEEPALGSKILIKLVTLMSQRLRSTSSNLLHYLER
jgi:CRP-like cAMP-binding protein